MARWLPALLGVLALVTSVATTLPASPCEPDGTACLVEDPDTLGALGVDLDVSSEASEGRDDDERDEEDPTDSDEIALGHEGAACPTRLDLAALAPTGQGHTHGSARGAHRGALERPPHA